MTCIPGFQTVDEAGQPIALCNVANRFVMPQPELVGRIWEEPIPIADLFEAYPTLRRVSRGDNWQLLLESQAGVVMLNPVTLFWVDSAGDRTLQWLPDTSQCLYLEFLYEPSSDTTVRSLQLRLKEAVDQNLVTTLRLSAVWGLLVQINRWLERYTRDAEPLWISAGLLIRDPQQTPLASASAQLAWVQALLEVDRATALTGARQTAALAAESLLAQFYGFIPVEPTEWLPQEFLLTAGETFELEAVVDAVVEFIDGVGLLLDDTVETVYQVYEGQLRGRSPTSSLWSGQNHEIDSWVNADGQDQLAAANQRIETVPSLNATIVLADPRAALLSPVFTPFNLGVFY